MARAAELVRRRLYNQRLAGPPFRKPDDAVGHFGAMQAQEFAFAKWSIVQRTRGATDATVHEAYAAGRILRTHVLRPTWHFVLPADIRWLLALTAPRVLAAGAYYFRDSGLDAAQFLKAEKAIAKALPGRHADREEMSAILERARVPPNGLRLGHILLHAELTGLVVSGAPKGKHHTYALLDERAPRSPALEKDVALGELAKRYFTSHGPATVKDAAWWSTLTTADIRRGIEAAGATLVSEVIDGRTYWFAPGRLPPKPPSPRIHLLQCYDELAIAYTESRDVFTGERPTTPAEANRPFMHPVVLDGRVLGTWRREITPKGISIDIRLDRKLRRAETRALEDEVARYGRSAGLPAKLR